MWECCLDRRILWVYPTPLPKAAHRADTAATGAFLWSSGFPSGVGAGYARKCARLPLAASQVLCLPHPTVGNMVLFRMGTLLTRLETERENTPFYMQSQYCPATPFKIYVFYFPTAIEAT